MKINSYKKIVGHVPLVSVFIVHHSEIVYALQYCMYTLCKKKYYIAVAYDD